jgi:hypothetical protein
MILNFSISFVFVIIFIEFLIVYIFFIFLFIATLPTENERIESLLKYNILDSPGEKIYDDLCYLSTLICNMKYGFIDVIDKERVYAKACIGANSQTYYPRSTSFW